MNGKVRVVYWLFRLLTESFSTDPRRHWGRFQRRGYGGSNVVIYNHVGTPNAFVDLLKKTLFRVEISSNFGTPNAFVDLLKKTLFRVEISSIKFLPCHS